MTAVEEWRPVIGWEGRYEVSNTGKVKSLARRVWNGRGFWANRPERVLTGTPINSGGLMVKLYGEDGSKKTVKIAVLVLTAFVGPKPEGMECCHADDDQYNNDLSNLRWDTRSSNIHDQVRNGGHNQARKTHCYRGHPLTGENLAHYGHSRVCRICRRIWRKEYDAKRRGVTHVDSRV